MKLPPYGRDVMKAVGVHRARGTRVLVLVGPHAWDWSRWWRSESDEDPMLIRQARTRYTCLLPPDATEFAESFRWPVLARPVSVANTGASDDELRPLIRALQRDGCREGEVLDISDWQMNWFAECRLRALQPWARASFDDAIEARAKHAERERDIADALQAIRLLRTDGDDLSWLEDLPSTSIGGEARERWKREVIAHFGRAA